MRDWVNELTRFCRLIILDKRRVGLSVRIDEAQLPELDERIDDLRAVMDQEGLDSAHLPGFSEGGPMAILFAASYPQRTRSLILYGCYACWRVLPGYSIGISDELHRNMLTVLFGKRTFPSRLLIRNVRSFI
jgi:pimeloyl-ACP methyl ester carboxylesterase